jgi:uncharacterized BrkB/YihY/UPF0761 family membrane protein
MPDSGKKEPPRVLDRGKRRAGVAADSAKLWLANLRQRSGPVDVVVRIYERDHQTFGSVLGSAVAFRLFLFVFSLVVLSLGVGVLVLGRGWLGDGLGDDLGLAKSLAASVDDALSQSESSGILLALGGLVATLWAGRNLAITLTAASANAWRIPRPGGMTSARAVGVVIGLLSAVLVFASVLRLAQDSSHLLVVATSIMAIFVAYAAAWFALTLVLPRATRDPTSLLPGAALTGVTFAGLSWVSQFYLVPRLDTGSEVLGGVGLTAVALGWLFIASRIMVAGLVVNAVLYEQYGSLLDLLLSLPGLRRLRRYEWIRRLLQQDFSESGEPVDALRDPAMTDP